MIPAAALAVIRAELEDAPTAEILTRPGWTAQRIAHALIAQGWTISVRQRTVSRRPETR